MVSIPADEMLPPFTMLYGELECETVYPPFCTVAQLLCVLMGNKTPVFVSVLVM